MTFPHHIFELLFTYFTTVHYTSCIHTTFIVQIFFIHVPSKWSICSPQSNPFLLHISLSSEPHSMIMIERYLLWYSSKKRQCRHTPYNYSVLCSEQKLFLTNSWIYDCCLGSASRFMVVGLKVNKYSERSTASASSPHDSPTFFLTNSSNWSPSNLKHCSHTCSVEKSTGSLLPS